MYAPPLWLKIIGPVAGVFAAAAALVSTISEKFYNKETHRPGVRELKKLRYEIANKFDWMRTNRTFLPGAAVPASDVLIKQTSASHIGEFNNFIKEMEAASGVVWEKNTVFASCIDRLKIAGEKGLVALHDESGYSKEAWKAQEKMILKTFGEAKNALLESRGFATKGLARIFQGTWQRWEWVGEHTRPGIIVGAVISAGAVIASLFMLNLNTRLRHELRDIHGKLGDISAGGDSPEHGPIREGALLPPKLPSSQIDVQDAQHDRMTARPEHARA